LYQTKYLTQEEFENINEEATSLLKMLRSAILTTKNNINKNKK